MCKVSVIIPYYNSEKTIARALNSVVSQIYKDFEVILVDDGSTDGSHRLVDEFIESHTDYSFKNIYQENAGPSKARNRGIDEAKGEYIAFLDSDDSWNIDKLKVQVGFLKNRKDAAILGSGYNLVLHDKVVKKKCSKFLYKPVNFYNMLFKVYFMTPAVIVKKQVIKLMGGFNENQKYAEDTLLYIKIARKYCGGIIGQPLVNLYKNEYGDSGLSSGLKETESWELNNFKRLRQENRLYEKKIGLLLYFFVCTVSLLKYFRRLLIVKLRKR